MVVPPPVMLFASLPTCHPPHAARGRDKTGISVRLCARDVPTNATNLAVNRRCQRLTACYNQRKRPPRKETLEERDELHRHHDCWRNDHLPGRQTLFVDALVHSAGGPTAVLLALPQDT